MSHTEGEMRTGSYEGGWDGLWIGYELIFKLALNNPDNATRAALCWNDHDKLTEQRDALLAACKVGLSYINAIITKVPRPIEDLKEDKELVESIIAGSKT